jgi:hypothetical protein
MLSEWSLVAVGVGDPVSWTAVRPLTSEELEGYQARCDLIRGVVASRMPFRNMIQAYGEFLSHVQSLEGNAAALAGRPLEEWGAPLNHRLDAVLIAMRGLLDQTEFRLSRAGVEGATGLALLESSRRARHARSSSYRIAYAMRDYVQHARPALTGSRVSGSFDPMANTTRHTFTLACSRDDLLGHGFDWKRARADLEALPEKFDPRPILREAIGELAELDRELFMLDVDRIKDANAWIEALLAQADSSGEPARGTIAKIEDAGVHAATGRSMWTVTILEAPIKFGWP